MVTNKDRMVEWLTRKADEMHALQQDPEMDTLQALAIIRSNYEVINVLTKVAKGDAYMKGIKPLNDVV